MYNLIRQQKWPTQKTKHVAIDKNVGPEIWIRNICTISISNYIIVIYNIKYFLIILKWNIPIGLKIRITTIPLLGIHWFRCSLDIIAMSSGSYIFVYLVYSSIHVNRNFTGMAIVSILLLSCSHVSCLVELIHCDWQGVTRKLDHDMSWPLPYWGWHHVWSIVIKVTSNHRHHHQHRQQQNQHQYPHQHHHYHDDDDDDDEDDDDNHHHHD